MADLTDKALRRKWAGSDEWLSDGGTRGAGRLIAKRAQAGLTFYFQYYDGERRRFLPIGPYDPKGERGKTLRQARDKAHEWSALYRSRVSDLHGHLEALEADRQRQRKQTAAAALAEEQAARRSSLRQLLDAYCAALARAGKHSAGDVGAIFRLHVYKADPLLAERKAADIPVDEFVSLLGKLIEAGKGRTAAKLRSCLRAAYGLAIKARTDPDAPLSLRAFGITANPIASIGALSQYNRARDRNLSAEELRAFMARLAAMPESVKKDALTLCIALGGQRPVQLLRARLVDLDLGAGTLTLYDGKGSRKQPRAHVLPLTTEAAAILRRLADRSAALTDGRGNAAPCLFTTDGHSAPLRIEAVSRFVHGMVTDMVQKKEAREGFELRDLRRTCETMLAALGVSSDVRAQLQSHGLGGVQTRHYDRHTYMNEKLAALEKWQRHLDLLTSGKTGKVVEMPRPRVGAIAT